MVGKLLTNCLKIYGKFVGKLGGSSDELPIEKLLGALIGEFDGKKVGAVNCDEH